ncbi:helicase-related protein [Dyadobacter fermentans]|uniref:Helicase domain protein n=1 Tax=Dyadobacter fermentans (strain ATCC 700827 / DSM 18053 / CIP 107007 / KCTC 52180 / NS114) TaxID=471854 RepID=C6VT59_DYAFD|nr:helicase-related protein [Dyadobacter fermentans]ACT96423.1 helicase domain protein [Dyadobacter fermentans DSM 18053]
MKIFNNIDSRLGDDLKLEFRKGSKLSVAASAFSIYAFEALRKELKSVEELRFIFTTPTFLEEKSKPKLREFYIPNIRKESDLCGGEFELRLKNEMTQRAISRECAQWVKDKAVFKTNTLGNSPMNSLIHVDNGPEDSASYSGFAGFTSPDLGFTSRKGHRSMITKVNYPMAEGYLEWFDEIWNNDENTDLVTESVLRYLAGAYQENSPEFVYFVTLYNIFRDFLSDLSLDNLPNDSIGFKETVIWNRLYNFQQDAVIGGINKLEKYNGCIIADSVGLGKTFTALGIIKYYEKRNKDVLVLCPKKLEANWNTYRHNDKNNILGKDRFRYDVLFHTDLSRDKGTSNGRNLESVNWGNYGLVVIDESHNFRNNNTVVGKENRYQKLLRKIVQEGIETKVLMLSATPVNNRFNDLRNQLALAYEGAAGQIDEKLDTDLGIELVFRRAQQAFNSWSKLPTEERTSDRLLEALDFDFFQILDSLTIARSRKHITNYYDTAAIGKFPQRNKPISIYSPLKEGTELNYKHIADWLEFLNLSIYSPLNYILPSKIPFYAEKYDKRVKSGTFKQRDREKSLQLLMRINLLKRIESSVDSFALTLLNIRALIEEGLGAIARGDANTYSGLPADPTSEEFDWEPDWGEEENVFGSKVKVHIADMDKVRWQEDLSADLLVINELLKEIELLRGKCDLKLGKLRKIIVDKIQNPANAGNKKVIVFTAFADTANYIYSELKDYFRNEYGLNTALITGSKRACSSKTVPSDLNTLLTCFSPRSKGKAIIYPDIQEEIDILIATDCISEGQNLQDCDYLINYDIHWNPVRIIQRFGRIDRIGSANDTITMVNFWPDVTLDAYINLKQRVENKMAISNLASTGDDNILNADEKDLEYRKIQLKRLQEEVVDLEDLREGVSITDLGLNDFRVDLANFVKIYPNPDSIPLGLHAVTPASDVDQRGVIFVLKNISDSVDKDKLNRLAPYYVVYIQENENVLHGYLEAKKSLDMLRLLCKGKTEPLKELCKQLNLETRDFRDMHDYSQLLQKSIRSILKTGDEKEVLSLFKAGGTATIGMPKGIEDFTLVSFVIVK